MDFTFEPALIHLGATVTFRVSKERSDEADAGLLYFVVAGDRVVDFGAVALVGDSETFFWTPDAVGPATVLVFRREGGDIDAADLADYAATAPDRVAAEETRGRQVRWRAADGTEGRFVLEFLERLSVLAAPITSSDIMKVQLQPTEPGPQVQDVLNRVIVAQSTSLSFQSFDVVATDAVCSETGKTGRSVWFGEAAYRALRDAALQFVDDARGDIPDDLLEAWNLFVVPPENTLPYVNRILPNAATRGTEVCPPEPEFPGTELIWSYWHEEGMLVQTLNHILARFQNRRIAGHDPLARFDVNPLLPLRNLLWGFAEDEFQRLTVRRRAAEYHYEYGLQLIGRAVPAADTYADTRTRFLEAFHALLHAAIKFYEDSNNLTVQPDAFPILNALRETHLVLAQGAHNQFADLPRRARAEMLAMQWILARPEMREFLGGRPSVPYQEPWMDRVDTMKAIYGWTDVTVTHFHDLAFFGEQLVLSVRLGDWNDALMPREAADTWARFWRNAIQRYVHAYRAATGIDLTEDVDATMPSRLMARRVRSRRA
jgi:hypothetical protein